jgi:hypothetical protein
MSNYAIADLKSYAIKIRELAAENISTNYQNDNLEDYITLNQMINLIKSECLGFDEQDRPILDETINDSIFTQTSVWIYNVGLSKLASKGFVECSWDNDKNEMIFWPSKIEKSNETKSKPRRKNTKNKRSDS